MATGESLILLEGFHSFYTFVCNIYGDYDKRVMDNLKSVGLLNVLN